MLGTGEGVDSDWRLDAGVPAWARCTLVVELLLFEDRAERESFGVSSFKPFDGDNAENLWECVVSLGGATEAVEATEPVDDLRRALKETESRLDFRGIPPEGGGPEACLGTRELMDGEARTDCRLIVVVSPAFTSCTSPFSRTPNSFVVASAGVGEGSVEGAVTLRLMRRLAIAALPSPGDPAADVRLEMRGIFVGVSFGIPPIEFSNAGGG